MSKYELTCGHSVPTDPDLRMIDDFKRVWWRCIECEMIERNDTGECLGVLRDMLNKRGAE